MNRSAASHHVGEVARLFTKLGVIGFGGPAAHIALMRDEVVRRVDALKLPSYTGFVMPVLTPVRAADGSMTDVTISYPMDLTAQMLAFSGVRPTP